MKSNSSVQYIQGRHDGRKESKDIVDKLANEVISLKKIVNCKHLRVSGIRAEDGFMNTCMTCGHQWFKTDRPLTELELMDKAKEIARKINARDFIGKSEIYERLTPVIKRCMKGRKK